MQTDLTLTYLMCSRLIHDLSAPLSAISIGLDMLPENNASDSPQRILQYSVSSAINRLELLRCLSGYTNSQDQPAFTDVVRIINKSVDLDKFDIHWLCRLEDTLSGDAVRLIVAIILITIDSLPRGGKISIHPDFSIEAFGHYVKPNGEVMDALTGKLTPNGLTSRGIIGYLAYLLCQKLGTKVNHTFPKPNQMIFYFD